MFQKYLYNLGLRLVRKHYSKEGASCKCPSCNTWSADLETPYLFTHTVTESVTHREGHVQEQPTGEVYMGCSQCGSVSKWHFALAPVAVCLGYTPPLSVFQHSSGFKTDFEFTNDIDVSAHDSSRVLTSIPKDVLTTLRSYTKDDLGKSPRLKV